MRRIDLVAEDGINLNSDIVASYDVLARNLAELDLDVDDAKLLRERVDLD